ncbi:hypothetical protein [Epilithonimonas mollis]|uniref:Uncharacterized protein n=1 Tax=Epilithonimonas mollis TaxID=216903 RepID=A0A1M6NK63_9FLAO|nr:hypothetical protein [Epilithonimonas mollis]SHJ96135.1 hypothetical protein SAMN05444371_0473 [Epilithonimonas mollis]
MSKFLPEKRKLIEDVFEKASAETTEKSFSGILKFLERTLLDDFKIILSYRTFETYYNHLVKNDEDYNIKPLILDDLSVYLGYNNFKEYCAEWKTVEYSVKESISKVVINVINKPLLKIPEFLTKHSNFGIIGVLILGSFFIRNKFYKAEAEPQKISETDTMILKQKPFEQVSASQSVIYVPQKLINIPKEKPEILDLKQCMYWNGNEYIPEDCNDTRDGLVAIDMKKVDHFKKIMRPDTITSIKNIWYSKHKNVVEFFTADGINPENHKSLNPLTEYMLENYITK